MTALLASPRESACRVWRPISLSGPRTGRVPRCSRGPTGGVGGFVLLPHIESLVFEAGGADPYDAGLAGCFVECEDHFVAAFGAERKDCWFGHNPSVVNQVAVVNQGYIGAGSDKETP